MKRRSIAVLLIVAAYGVARGTTRAGPPSPPTSVDAWTLVWSDEFDGTSIDRRKWTVADASRPNYDGGINYYDPANVSVSDGNLVLRTQAHRRVVGGKSLAYGSGRVTTEGKFSFLYGRVDVRAKLPGTKGLWPAIWMLPADDTWPPEIDVMELLGDRPTRDYMTLHYGSRRRPLSSQATFDGPDFTADFHVFSVEWDPGRIRWLVDGVERAANVHNVPGRAMFLLLNTSIGGNWPGKPDRSTVLPQTFEVDYVRVYKRGA